MKFWFVALMLSAVLAGCETVDIGTVSRAAMNEAIRQEAPGNYFIGRRMYKLDTKCGAGYASRVNHGKQHVSSCSTSNVRWPPTAARGKIGSDNNYEYRISGYFSGDTVYEPASNGFYPEFVLLGAEVRSTNPPNIYQEKRQSDPKVRVLQPPS